MIRGRESLIDWRFDSQVTECVHLCVSLLLDAVLLQIVSSDKPITFIARLVTDFDMLEVESLVPGLNARL